MILKITLHCLGGVVNLELVLGSNKITLEDLVNVTRRGYKVKISEEAYEKIDRARALVDKYVEEGKVSYGITTGFGKFAEVTISKEETGQLQKNIIMSHSCSVGNPIILPHNRPFPFPIKLWWIC